MTTEITSTSTLTEVFAALDAQGIYAHRAASQGPDAKGIEYWAGQGKTGLVWFTPDDMEEWHDSRHLTIHFGTVEGGDLYDVEMSLWTAINRAGFQTVVAPKSNNSIVIHVPKSRF